MEITMRFNESRCDGEQIMHTIRKEFSQVADDVASHIADGIADTRNNQPLNVANEQSTSEEDKEKALATAITKAEKTKPPYTEEMCKTKHFESVVACINGHLVYLNITTQKLPSDATAVFEDFPSVPAFLQKTVKRWSNVDFFCDD